MRRTFPMHGGLILLTLNKDSLATVQLDVFTSQEAPSIVSEELDFDEILPVGPFRVFRAFVPPALVPELVRKIRKTNDSSPQCYRRPTEDEACELGIAQLDFVRAAFKTER